MLRGKLTEQLGYERAYHYSAAVVLIPDKMTATEEDEADEMARFPKSICKNGTKTRKRGQVFCRPKLAMQKQFCRASAIDPVEE